MSLKTIISLTVVGILLVLGFSLIGSYFSYNNTEVALRQEADAQVKKIETTHDAMWKILSEQAGVTEQYKESFNEIYKNIMDARYSKGDGSLMKWVTESNPNFDVKLYDKLMNSIEIQRTTFKTSQDRLSDIIREHNTLLNSYPSKWFISNNKPIEQMVISSSKTKKVMETGVDDDVDLFKKK